MITQKLIAQFIGHNIKKWRGFKKLTQADLAVGINKSRASIANYELGHTMPPLDILYQIAECCEVPLSHIAWSKLPTTEEIKTIIQPKTRQCEHCKGKGQIEWTNEA